MANNTADGSVVIPVDMNVSQAEKKLNKLTKDIEDSEKKVQSFTQKRNEAEEKSSNEAKAALEAEKKTLQEMQDTNKKNLEIEESLKKARAESGKAEDELKAKLSERGDLLASIELKEKSIQNLNEQIATLKSAVQPDQEAISGKKTELSMLKVSLEKAKTELAETDVRVKTLTSDIEQQNLAMERTAAKMTESYSGTEIDMQKEKVQLLSASFKQAQRDVEKYNALLPEATNALEIQRTEAGTLAQQIENANGPAAQFGQRMKDAGKSVDVVGNRIKKLASRVLVFSVITMALRGMREWMGNVIKTNDEARQSMAQLKGALLTLVQPLVNIVIPAFVTFVNVLTKAVTAIASLVSKVFGTTVEKSAEAAKKLNDQQKALSGVGSAAKKATKQMAAFDEINQIGDQDAGAGGGGAASTNIEPDFAGAVKGQISGIAEFLTGMALVALGAILTFTGASIPVGLALMVAGAAMIYGALTENWDSMEEALQGPIGAVVALVTVALLAIGAILAFSGANLPLGIALIALGAVGLATTIKANWSTIKNALKGEIGAIVLLVSVALLAIGAILAFSGANIPLGIALLAAGAIGIVATIAANWDSMDEALKGPIGVVVALVGAALLALGAILAFSGINLLLGIALLAAGAVILVATIAANWDTVQNALQGPIGAVVGIVSGILLVLGVILLFTGAGIPLGLGLIAVGAVGLAAAIIPNWNYIIEKLKGAWDNIKSWWASTVVRGLKKVPKFFIENVINKLLAGAENFFNFFINGINNLISKLNSFGFDLPDVLGGGHIGFSIPKLTNISLPRVPVPALAEGAVIPPNKKFMAVLGDQKNGTNLEAPADLIRSIVREEVIRAGSQNGDIKIVFDGDLAALARILNPHIEREQHRVGVNFVNAGYRMG